MKNLLALFLALIPISVAQDCIVTATTSTNDSIVCGDCITLIAYGESPGNAFLSEDFASGFGPGWNSTPGATSFSNPCSPGGVDGTPHAWMDNNTAVPRTLTSAPYDFSSSPAGVTVCFDLLFAEQGDAAPCEGPDEPDEGVYLQYSTDGGATWIDLHYFDPNGGNDPTLTNWNNYCFDLPPSALVNGVQIRWHQTADSGADYDHWGVDNVVIYQNDPNYELVWSHDGYSHGVGVAGGENPNQVCPTTETTYEVVMTNVNNPSQTCTSTVTVPVKLPNILVEVSPTDTMICPGECIDITATAKVIESPAKVATYENNQLEIVASGSASVNINITDLNQTTVNNGAIQEICINGFNFSGSELCTNFIGGCNCNGTNISFGESCDVDASSFNITVSSPDGCIITLVPANTLVTTGIQDMCFVPVGGADVSTGSGNYSGTWDPNGSFDDVAGCQANGVWTLEFNTGNGGLGIGFGSLTGWSITFDDPEISYPADYTWSPTTGLSDPNSLTPTACVSSATAYTITAEDANGCTSESATVNITMDPVCCPFQVIDNDVQDPSCANNDGIIDLSFINGTGPYNVLSVDGDVSGPLAGYPLNGVNGIVLNTLSAETWTITIEDAGAGCTKDTIITLNPSTTPTLSVSDTALCDDGSTVDLNLLITTLGNISLHNSQADADAGINPLASSNVGAGTYFIRSEDATDPSCYVTDVINVALNALPVINITPAGPFCNNDPAANLTATPAGGTFNGNGISGTTFDPVTAGVALHTINYDYTDPTTGCSNNASIDIDVVICCAGVTLNVRDTSLCDDGVSTVDLNLLSSSTGITTYHANQTDADAGSNPLGSSVVGDGSYVVRAEDVTDPTCYTTATINVTLNALPVLTIDPLGPLCDTLLSVPLTATPVGGIFSGTGVNGNNFEPINAGIATHTIQYDYTDPATGCSNTTTADIDVIFCCPGLSLTVRDTSLCDDGVSTVDLSLLTNSNAVVSYHNTNTDADNSLNPITNLNVGAGTYFVRGEDATDPSCYIVQSINVTLNALPVINITPLGPLCEGSSAVALSATPIGGVFSGNGVSGSNFDPVAAGISSNIITYDYTDATTGCSNSNTTTIDVIACCNGITVQTMDTTLCDDGTSTVDLNLLANSSNGVLSFHNNLNDANNQSNALTNTNVSGGNYYVRSTDANDNTCYTVDSITVTLNEVPSFTLSDLNVCPDDLITIAVQNLSPSTATVTWDQGVVNGQSFNAGNSSNTYNVTVDNNGCTNTGNINVNITQPNITNLSINPPVCEGDANGNVNAIANGLAPLSYTWNTTPPTNAPYVDNLNNGTYTLTVEDGNGCTTDTTITLNTITNIQANYTVNEIPCDDFAGGSILVQNITGGTAPYNVSANGITADANLLIDSLDAGDYQVVLIDANGCSAFGPIITLNNPNLPTASFALSDNEFTTDDVQATATNISGYDVQGWILDGQFINNTNDIYNLNISGLEEGDYELCLEVIDTNGCTDISCTYFRIIEKCVIYIPNSFTPNDDGVNDLFQVELNCYDDFEMMIFNRWGQVIYKSTNPYDAWDGVLQNGKVTQQGAYPYRVIVKLNDEEKEIKGHVLVFPNQ